MLRDQVTALYIAILAIALALAIMLSEVRAADWDNDFSSGLGNYSANAVSGTGSATVNSGVCTLTSDGGNPYGLYSIEVTGQSLPVDATVKFDLPGGQGDTNYKQVSIGVYDTSGSLAAASVNASNIQGAAGRQDITAGSGSVGATAAHAGATDLYLRITVAGDGAVAAYSKVGSGEWAGLAAPPSPVSIATDATVAIAAWVLAPNGVAHSAVIDVISSIPTGPVAETATVSQPGPYATPGAAFRRN